MCVHESEIEFDSGISRADEATQFFRQPLAQARKLLNQAQIPLAPMGPGRIGS